MKENLNPRRRRRRRHSHQRRHQRRPCYLRLFPAVLRLRLETERRRMTDFLS